MSGRDSKKDSGGDERKQSEGKQSSQQWHIGSGKAKQFKFPMGTEAFVKFIRLINYAKGLIYEFFV